MRTFTNVLFHEFQETIEEAMKEEINENYDLNDDKYILRTTSDEEIAKLAVNTVDIKNFV